MGLGQTLRIANDLPDVGLERRLQRLSERHGFCRNDVDERPALKAGEHDLVEFLGVGRLAQDQTGPRTTQRLVGRGRDEIAVGHRAGVVAGGHQSGDVGHVRHDLGAAPSRDRRDPLEVDHARIRGRAADDQLRSMLVRESLELVVVERLIARANAVRDELVELPGEVERVAVREVPAVRQIHPKTVSPGWSTVK
jgi:hypothetical protein